MDDPQALRDDTRFQLGCIAKTMTSIIAMELVARNELDLDAPIDEYIPLARHTSKDRDIRVRHLMDQTSGFAGVRNPYGNDRQVSWESLAGFLAETPQLFRPGTVFNNEGLSSAILGKIVESLSKRSAYQLISDLILRPLMPDSKKSRDRRPFAFGHGLDADGGAFVRFPRALTQRGMWSPSCLFGKALSVTELASFGELLVTGRSPFSGRRVLAESTTRRLGEKGARLPSFVGERHPLLLPTSFRCGVSVYTEGIVGCDGMGVGQSLAVRSCPSKNATVAVAVNATGSRARTVLLAALMEDLGWVCNRDGASSMSQPLAFDLAELDGKFLGADGATVTVHQSHARIELRVRTTEQMPVLTITGSGDYERNAFVLDENQPLSGIGFFADSDDAAPCIQLGLYAYKKV